MANKPKDTRGAFLWIVGLLRRERIPFRIVGGFAARIHGCKRPLADIDLEMADSDVPRVEKLCHRYTIYGPNRYRDDEFDLLLATLEYRGQEIDLCGIDTQRLHDEATDRWGPFTGSLDRFVRKKVFGKIVPVIPKADLIRYKKRIRREVDIADLAEIQSK